MNDRVERTEPVVNGVDKPNGIHSSSSPVDVLADHENQQPESNARSEPFKPNVVTETLKDASLVSQVESAQDAAHTISTDTPAVTPIVPSEENDIEHAQAENTPVVNGSEANGTDIVMGENDEHTPATTPGVSTSGTLESVGSSTSHTTPNDGPDEEDDKPPPAKRARVYSDADKASLAHSASPPPQSTTTSNVTTPVPPAEGATPPPTTADTAEFSTDLPIEVPSTSTIATEHGTSTLSVPQYRFCQSTIRTLKKMKDAGPFLRPVDPVLLNIPHYPSIVKNPMDFSTAERKLTASNPVKPDPNPTNPRYYSAEDFIADIRLIFSNCVTFNGPDHVVTAMGRRVEEVFDKQIKNLPPAETPKPPVVKKQSTPPRVVAAPPPPPPAKKIQNRRPSTSVPVIRRSDVQTDAVGRPKREIHPPPPKDLAYADPPKKARKSKPPKDDGTADQLKYCVKILDMLHKKQHAAVAAPFYEPVDWVKLEIPSYPKIIKRPMDMSTMRRKLEQHEYPNAQKFYNDFKLMIRNCFDFNPAGTPVNQAGQELQRLFDERWKSLPPLHPHGASEEEEEEEEETSQDERDRAIAMMEQQIENINRNISALKGKSKEKKKEKKKEKPPVASTSKAAPKPPKASSSSKKKVKKPIADDDVLSFEQKKDLSEAIATLEGTKLEKVIQIIHEGVPEIRDSTEEIELEIDTLPAPVLTKLYNFVIRPMKPPPPKRNRPGKGTGTGGLKRKSMDEDVEAAKIRQLEERMALFEQSAGGGATSVAPHRDSDQSSDSSSGSDTSGSDSE